MNDKAKEIKPGILFIDIDALRSKSHKMDLPVKKYRSWLEQARDREDVDLLSDEEMFELASWNWWFCQGLCHRKGEGVKVVILYDIDCAPNNVEAMAHISGF